MAIWLVTFVIVNAHGYIERHSYFSRKLAMVLSFLRHNCLPSPCCLAFEHLLNSTGSRPSMLSTLYAMLSLLPAYLLHSSDDAACTSGVSAKTGPVEKGSIWWQVGGV